MVKSPLSPWSPKRASSLLGFDIVVVLVVGAVYCWIIDHLYRMIPFTIISIPMPANAPAVS